jgi:ABC-type multidrug transport system ATPase subunit
MSELELEDLLDDGLGPLDLRFGPGLNVCLADSVMMLARLVELASGARTPRRGRALYARANLRESPEARRKMACLRSEEALPAAANVRDSLAIVLGLRGSQASPDALLDEWGLGVYARSAPDRLRNDERRALQLAVCLSGIGTSLILLHDPLALAPRLSRRRMLARCAELSREQTLLITTDSLPDAIAFGGRAYLFERGRVSNFVGLALHRVGESLRVRSMEAKRLAEALGAESCLHVRFDAHASKSELSVSGETLASLATSVARVASEQRIAVESLSLELPSLASLLSARATQRSRPTAHAPSVSPVKPT